MPRWLALLGERLEDPKGFARAYGIYQVCLIAAALCSAGWLQPDEHFRVAEPAHKLVFGFATMPWELGEVYPVVSYLLGALHALPLWVCRILGVTSPNVYAAALRLFSALVCSTRLIAFWGLGRTLRLPRLGILVLLYALGPLSGLLLVRTSQENWATTAGMWAAALLVRVLPGVWTWRGFLARPQPAAPRHGLAAVFGLGVCLSLSVSFRNQMGPSCAVLAFLAAWGLGPTSWAPLALGLGAGLVPLALVDWWTVGTPFAPARNYLAYAAADERGGADWGRSPWTLYLWGFAGTWYPPFSVVLLPLICLGAAASPLLGGCLLPFTALHLALGHKELRYFSPMLPWFWLATWRGGALAAAAAPWAVQFTSKHARLLVTYGLGAGALGMLICAFPVNSTPALLSEVRRRLEEGADPAGMTMVARSLTGIDTFYLGRKDNLPAQWDPADFWQQRFSFGNGEPRTFIFSRVESQDLREIERMCMLNYLSAPAWYRALLDIHPRIPRRKTLDAIVQCPRPGGSS